MSETPETISSESTTPAPEPEAPKSLITAEVTTEETTETVETPVEPVVPLIAEDLALPEGFEFDETLRDELLSTMNNADLSAKDRATALIDLHTKALTQASEAASQAWDSLQEQWQNEVKADPEIGGTKLQPALASISKLVSEYGSTELADVFNLTGAGNNPHMIKFLSNIAAKMTEGGFAPGSPAGGESSAAQRMFPSMKG